MFYSYHYIRQDPENKKKTHSKFILLILLSI